MVHRCVPVLECVSQGLGSLFLFLSVPCCAFQIDELLSVLGGPLDPLPPVIICGPPGMASLLLAMRLLWSRWQ